MYYEIEYIINGLKRKSIQEEKKTKAFNLANRIWFREHPSELRIIQIENEDYEVIDYRVNPTAEAVRIGKIKNGKMKNLGFADTYEDE